LQGFKVLLDISPGKAAAGIFESWVKRFSEHPEQESCKTRDPGPSHLFDGKPALSQRLT